MSVALAVAAVLVHGGTYEMPLQTGRIEQPREVRAFWLDRTPVTNGDFLAFVRARPQWRRDRIKRLVADASYLARWAAPDALGPRAPERAPVVEISWFAARAYCAWRGGRLPREAEWELAAKDEPDDIAWYETPTADVLPSVHAGTKLADLHGLVWEWIEDYNASPVGTDPQKACGAAGGDIAPEQYATYVRFTFRGSLEAHFTAPSLGFRCAYDGVMP